MSKKVMKKISIVLSILILFTACSSAGATTVEVDETLPARDSVPVVLKTTADGINVINGTVSSIDISNIANGYFMVKYSGSNAKVKMQVSRVEDAGSDPYSYDIQTLSEYTAFPLTPGNGQYTVSIFEQIQGTSYALMDTYSFSLTLEDEFGPYLHPSYYVNFTESSNAVAVSQEVVKEARSELDAVAMIYNYVVSNVEYDYEFASAVSGFYIPDIDETLDTQKGICFHYAALMTSMLRAQRIPTQLVLGYAGDVYHAWISVHTPETGWINNAIQFDGEKWIRMDPTFESSSGGRPGIEDYIGDGENYNAMFFY